MPGTASGARVDLEKLVYSYDGSRAVDDVDLTIEAGSFCTLLGPSGSGKTTTLMAIAGFLAPDAGRICIDGEDMTHVATNHRNLGVVFQNYALFPHMTVSQNVAFPLKMRRKRRHEIERRVGDALRLVGLDDFGGRKPRQLSGGQQQRVAVARALVFEPRVLLMDEPLGALDRKLRNQLQIELKRLQRTLGVTVIFVTHDQGEALTMSDQIVIMRNGRVEQVGSATQLYEHPRTRFVADFIGESNFLPGRVLSAPGSGTATVHVGDNLTFQGILQPRLSVGDTAWVQVRPEHLELTNRAPEAEENSMRARIIEEIYLGESVRYQLEALDGGVERWLTAKTPCQASDERWAVGDVVNVVWQPKVTHLMCDEADSD